MATDNRGVMVYLPSELEAKIAEYCTEHNITRKDKQGNIVTSLGSGIVAYLKSHLLSDTLSSVNNRPIPGLTREKVLDLIAESSTSKIPIIDVASLAENRSLDPINTAVVCRLETVEQQLSSLTGISRDEVEQLIQASEQRVLEASRSLWAELRGELAGVKTIEARVNIPSIAISTASQEKIVKDTTKSTNANTTNSVSSWHPNHHKHHKRWFDLMDTDEQFNKIIEMCISDDVTNKTVVNRLFKAGYGEHQNTKPYLPSLAIEIKNVWQFRQGEYAKESAREDRIKLTATNTTDDATYDLKPMSKDVKRWLERLKDQKFKAIIQTGISDKCSNQEIVTRLFDAGYGKNNNTKPYRANLASAMKTAFLLPNNRGQS